MPQAEITTERVVSTHYFLRKCFNEFYADSLKKYNETNPKGANDWRLFRTSAFTFLAFYVEAYINYVLYAGFPEDYNSLERNPIKEKIKFILQRYEIKNVNLSPIMDLFIFRNDLAHGKVYSFPPRTIKIPVPKDAAFNDDVYKKIDDKNKIKWEKFINRDFEKVMNHVHRILSLIDEKSKLPFRLNDSADYRPRSYKVLDE